MSEWLPVDWLMQVCNERIDIFFDSAPGLSSYDYERHINISNNLSDRESVTRMFCVLLYHVSLLS